MEIGGWPLLMPASEGKSKTHLGKDQSYQDPAELHKPAKEESDCSPASS